LPPTDFYKSELVERRRELHKRVSKLAETLEQQRRIDAVVTSASNARNTQDEEKYPELKTRRR
jgi:hypothetical protein